MDNVRNSKVGGGIGKSFSLPPVSSVSFSRTSSTSLSLISWSLIVLSSIVLGEDRYTMNLMNDRATATITAVIVDDEQLACEELSYLLKEFPDLELLATARNGIEAVKLIEDLEPDIAFL